MLSLYDKAMELHVTHKETVAVHKAAVADLKRTLDEFLLQSNGLGFTYKQSDTVSAPNTDSITVFQINQGYAVVVIITVTGSLYNVGGLQVTEWEGDFDLVVAAIAEFVEDYLP